MQTDELKLRLCNFLNSMVDTYYGGPMVGEKMLNYTLKVVIKNNIHKLNPVLALFADENGEIDAVAIINDYKVQMGNERLTIDLRDYIDSPMIKSILPNKALMISAEDIAKIIY